MAFDLTDLLIHADFFEDQGINTLLLRDTIYDFEYCIYIYNNCKDGYVYLANTGDEPDLIFDENRGTEDADHHGDGVGYPMEGSVDGDSYADV